MLQRILIFEPDFFHPGILDYTPCSKLVGGIALKEKIMSKMRPHIKMILFYWIIIVAIESIIVLTIIANPFQNIQLLLIVLSIEMVQCFIFMMIFCNLPYFAIEIGELYVKGPSQFGLGWKKVVIPYGEFSYIVNNLILSTFGLYYIKSTQGKIISVMGFTEDQYKKLLEIISSKK